MECPTCGEVITQDMQFCPYCGEKNLYFIESQKNAASVNTSPNSPTSALDSTNAPAKPETEAKPKHEAEEKLKGNKAGKTVAIAAALLAVAFVVWIGVSALGGKVQGTGSSSRFVIGADYADVDGAALSQAAFPGDEHGYWHAQLNDQQRAIYDELWEHVSAGETSFSITSSGVDYIYYLDDRSVKSIILNVASHALLYDHPEIFWWAGDFEEISEVPTFDADSEPSTYVVLSVLYDPREWENVQTQMNERVEEFASTVTDDMADWEKALAAYEWLGEHVDLDNEAQQRLDSMYEEYYWPGEEEVELDTKGDFDPCAQSAASALINGLSTSVGYSNAYKLLLDRVGVPCTILSSGITKQVTKFGTDEDGIPWSSEYEKTFIHQLNLVWLCGEPGYSDAALGDEELGYNYDYFFMTDDEFEQFDYAFSDDPYFGWYDAWQTGLLPECTIDVGR